jgi:hypothetical protein
MLSSTKSRWLVAGAVATAALVAACNTDNMSSRPTPALSRVQAESLGQVMVANAQNELDGITLSGASFAPALAAPAGPMADGGLNCIPAISPMPVVNSDSDRVPDSVRITFPNCAFVQDSEADTISGSIDLIDPTPTVTDNARKLVFTNFRRVEVEDGRTRSSLVNGARQSLRDANQIVQSETNFRTVFVFGDGDTATSNRNWNVTFTADTAGSIREDAPLPSGTLDVNGTAMFTRDTNSFALTVSTSPVLHYNATCTVRPKFDAGTFKAVVTKNGATSTVTIAFTACGTFTVTRS